MIRLFIALGALILATTVFAQSADTYTSGHGALQVFDEQGWQSAPQWVQAWIGIMAMSFLAGILFVKNHVPARWVVGGFVAGILFSVFGFPALNLVELSGLIALVHIIFWSPGLYKVLQEKAFTGPMSAYSIWTGWISAVIGFSFIFDIRDAAIYLKHILIG